MQDFSNISNNLSSSSIIMTVDEHTPSPQEARGIYGFVFFLFLKSFLASYFVWMLLPFSWIEKFPYAPPQQYWGLAVPVFFCTGLFMFAFCIYPALHGLHDGSFDSPSAISDPDSHAEGHFDQVRSKKGKIVTPGVRRRYSEGRSLKAITPSAEIYEKSKTLSARERKFKEMQIRPIRSFPESDTRPIPPACDLDLDYVCKKLYTID